MGTRWSDTLALVDRPTGDRRRFAEGALDHRSLPLPLKWQREQNMGHDSSVVVGVIDTLDVDGKGQKVLAGGWFFDDLDPEFERLSADVREALMLATEGVIGPSVDLEPDFDVAVVKAGTDEPLEFEELMELGEDEQIEMLFTRAKIMGATLVSGPAFEHSSTDFKVFADDTSEDSSKASAMVASFGQHPEDYKVPAAAMFDNPGLAEPTGLTWTDEGHIFGHIALNASCHSGFPDVCITPPESKSDYSWFHRYPIETDDGIIWAGRITAGGRHADLSKAFDRAVDHYDKFTTAAYVVAGTDEFGIWISGALQPNLPDHVMSILGRRKPSGDWRETSDGLELIEVLALMPGPRELSEPGYPIETHVTNGRQTALVACLGPVSRETSQAPGAPAEIDYNRLGASIVATMREIERTEARREELAAAIRATADEQVAQARVRLAAALPPVIEGEHGPEVTSMPEDARVVQGV
jgi:hypothetical protein